MEILQIDPSTRTTPYGKRDWGVGHESCIRDFYYCIKEKITFEQDLEDVRRCITLMLDAYKSAREHTAIYYDR